MESRENVRKLISESSILSSVEKAEWIQLLPEMNDKQVLELTRILTPRQAQPQVFRPAAPITPRPPANLPISRQVNITQKEISTSVPFFEQEIAAPGISTQKLPQQPQIRSQQQQPQPAPTDPTELQKRVANIVREMDQRKAGILPPPPSALAPQNESIDLQQFFESDAPAPRPKPMAQPTPVREASPLSQAPVQRQELQIVTATDFAKLTSEYLENKNLNDVFEQLMAAIDTISKKEPIYDIVVNFERSPLHSAYVNLGAELLNDANPNRLQAYENAQAALQKRNLPALNKQQFEFLTDFRTHLQQLY